MNYKQTIDWLFNQLPVYQMIGSKAYKADLANTFLLLKHLQNPEKKLTTIHVAGTNGKGSTSHLLASVFQEAGYKVGLFTSPHLKDFRERIKINGDEIPKDYVVDFVSANKDFFLENQLSFFEMTVGLAFEYFAKEKTDINIIEVGLGGRLDSTNVITPEVSVITNIGKDHTAILGDTLKEIAFEKAGIIKKNVPVVIGEYTKETRDVFVNKAKEMQAPLYFASDEISEIKYPCGLLGDYQQKNCKTVLKVLQIIQEQKRLSISEENIKNGLMYVVKNTRLQGRWQQIHENPTAICDTGHNAHGLKIVLQQVLNQKYKKLRIVLGVVNDKDLDEILPLFPKKAQYYFCKPNVQRGLSAEILQQNAEKFGLMGSSYTSVNEAYKTAVQQSEKEDFIFVGGSTFVVAEII